MELSILNEINDIKDQELDSIEAYNEEFIYEQEIDRILNEAIEFLTEAYIGKTQYLQEIEDKLNQVRGNLNRHTDFDRTKTVQEINRLFEKQFGMDIFALHMVNENQMNAYTCTIGIKFDIYKKNYYELLVADRKDGYRFKPNNNFCISANVYYGLLANPDLTDGEILAIILHEIGHNFASFLDNKIRVANSEMLDDFISISIMKAIFHVLTLRPISAIKDIHNLISTTNELSNKKDSKSAKKDQDKDERKIKAAIDGVKGTYKDFADVVKEVLYKTNIFVMLKAKFRRKFLIDPYKKSRTQAAKVSIDRRDEIIADKFAAVYGYGPELASGLDKMRMHKYKEDEIIEKIPVFGKKICDFWDKLYYDINEFDCHPHSIQRINECIKTLEDELQQKDMDPKLKGAILEQIKIMKNQIEDVKKNVDDSNIRSVYAAYVANKLPDATTKQIEDEINKEFNDALKNNN